MSACFATCVAKKHDRSGQFEEHSSDLVVSEEGPLDDSVPLESRILALEQARREAMLSADAQALSEFLDESLLYVHSSGISDSRGSYLSKLETGQLRYTSLTFLDQRVTLPAGDAASTAICTGRMHASLLREGRRAEVQSRYMACWACTPKGWRLLAVHCAAT